MNIKQKLQILINMNHGTPNKPLLFGNLKNLKKISMVALAALTASFLLGVTGPMTALAAGPAPVDLQSAGNFVILSKAGITDIPSSITQCPNHSSYDLARIKALHQRVKSKSQRKKQSSEIQPGSPAEP